MFDSLFLASSYKRIYCSYIKTCSSISLSIGTNKYIGLFHISIILILTIHIYDLTQHCSTCYIFRLTLGTLYSNTNNVVGTKFTCKVNREVISQTAVNKHHIPLSYRVKHPRYRHRSTHSLSQSTTMEIILCVIYNIRCYASKRSG